MRKESYESVKILVKFITENNFITRRVGPKDGKNMVDKDMGGPNTFLDI